VAQAARRDADRKIEVYAERHTNLDLWIMGYTGPTVHFLDEPVDILPLVSDVWTDVDTSSYAPGAIGIILNVGREFGGTPFTAVRKKGSTDDWYWITFQTWPVVGVDENGLFQIKMKDILPALSSAFVTGYFTAGATFTTDGIDISPPVNDTWVPKSIDHFATPPRWGIIEIHPTFTNKLYGAQKYLSRRDILMNGYAHEWAFVHCDREADVELYGETPGALFRLIGVTA